MADWLLDDPLGEPPVDFVLLRDSEIVNVTITKADLPDENAIEQGKRWVHVVMKADTSDGRLIDNIHHYVNFVKETDDAEKANRKKLSLRDFFDCFGIQPSARRPSDCALWVGHIGKIMVGLEADEGYGERNRVKRFLK